MTRALVPAVLAAALATPAIADVTPDDVLDSATALIGRLGGTLVVETQRTGDALDITGGQVSFDLPFETGTVRADLPVLALRDLGDGTVAVEWPASFEVPFSYVGPGQETGDSLTLQLDSQGSRTIASGDPADITFATESDGVAMRLVAANPETLGDLDVSFAAGPTRTTTRLIDGPLMVATVMLDQDGSEVVMRDSLSGAPSESITRYGETTINATMTLPEGAALSNLAPALRAGLSMNVDVNYATTETEQSIPMPDGSIGRLVQSVGPTPSTVNLDQSGLRVTGTASDLAMIFESPAAMPFPIAGAIAAIQLELAMPLLAGDAPQDARFLLGLQGLEIDESLWAMVDAGGALPRDPANVLLDVGASLSLGQDLVDISGLMAMGPGETPDIAVESLRIDTLNLAALGALVEGSGAFTLDNADMTTFDGFPRPDGEAMLRMTGVNALLQTLQDSGLLPPDQAMGAMMGLGMFAVPVGEDVLETQVEVKDGGQVYVNGVRMR